MVPVPVISGSTSGETIEIELIEWPRQARRWTIGAAEVFHYFIIKSKRMSWRAAVSWGWAFNHILWFPSLYGRSVWFDVDDIDVCSRS